MFLIFSLFLFRDPDLFLEVEGDVKDRRLEEKVAKARAKSAVPVLMASMSTSFGFLFCSFWWDNKLGMLLAMVYLLIVTIILPMPFAKREIMPASKNVKMGRYIALVIYQVVEGILIIMIAFNYKDFITMLFGIGASIGIVIGTVFGILHRKLGLNLMPILLVLGLPAAIAIFLELEYPEYTVNGACAIIASIFAFSAKILICFCPPVTP